MRLAFADPRNLTLSPLNMHHGRPDPDISDILPSVRQRGVLLTLLVKETMADGAVVEGHFEVVAGRRRWKASLAAIAEGVDIDPVPIGILEPGDDAAAIEASLIENLGRLPPDEVTCWETFTRLVKSGRTPVGQTAEAAQDIYVAQVAGELRHHLAMEERLVLVGEGDALGEVVAGHQPGPLQGLLPAQVVLSDVEGDAGQQRLGAAPVERALGEAQEGLLREVLGDLAAEAAGKEGHHPAAVGAVEVGDGGRPNYGARIR